MEKIVLNVADLAQFLTTANGGSPRSLILIVQTDEKKLLALYRGTYTWGWRHNYTHDKDFESDRGKLREAGFTEVEPQTITEYLTGWI